MRIVWRSVLLVGVWLIFESWISWAAFCDQTQYQSGGDEAAEKYGCIFKGPVVSLTVGVLRLWGYIFGHADAYVALFTAVLAISTILLWISTRDAARGGERSANIAERALTDLERPHLFVEVDMDRGDRGDISWSINNIPIPTRQTLTYQFVNYGRTPGFLTEIVENLRIAEDLPPPVGSETTIATSLPGVIVGPGKPYPFTMNFPPDPEKALRGNARLYLFGRARYDDIFTNGYVVGFCLMLDHRSHRFVTSGDQRYNYTRKERDGFAKPI